MLGVPADAIALVAVAIACALLLFLLVYSVAWAYRDAVARGKSGWLVALLVLLLDWPISLLLWCVFRPDLSSAKPFKS